MNVLLFTEKNLEKVKDICGMGGNSPGKQTFSIKNGKEIDGSNNIYLGFFGSKNSINLTKELLNDSVEEINEKNEIITKMNKIIKEDKGRKLPQESLLFSIKSSDLEYVRNILGVGQNSLERQSITIRSADNFSDKKGNYILIEGSEEAINLAKDLLNEYTNEITDTEKEEIVNKIKQEEESAGEGFGSIFG